MIPKSHLKPISQIVIMFLGCFTLYLIVIEANKRTQIRESEQTKRDAALSVEAQVERERSVLTIEKERLKHDKFLKCLNTLREDSNSFKLQKIQQLFIKIGCTQE